MLLLPLGMVVASQCGRLGRTSMLVTVVSSLHLLPDFVAGYDGSTGLQPRRHLLLLCCVVWGDGVAHGAMVWMLLLLRPEPRHWRDGIRLQPRVL
jgi:hypothetical protein